MTNEKSTNSNATQKASDIENFKDVIISFVSKVLSLSQAEEKALIENSIELSQQSTLPILIAHLTEKNDLSDIVDRLKEFGKNDAILENAHHEVLMKMPQG